MLWVGWALHKWSCLEIMMAPSAPSQGRRWILLGWNSLSESKTMETVLVPISGLAAGQEKQRGHQHF